VAADGHFLPLVPLAAAFRDRGDEVAVATAASFAPRVESAGLQALPAGIDQSALNALFAPYRAEIAALPVLERRTHAFSRRFALIDSPARVDDLRRQAEAWQPDLVVHESAELGGPLVAAALGLPSAHHSFGRMVPWAAIDGAAVIAARMWEQAGVAPEPFAGMFRGPYIDVCPPTLATDRPPAATPLLPLRALAAQPAQTTERPLIYVTLGTIITDLSVYQLVLAALAGRDADVLVTTGRQNDPAELGAVPGNVRVERYVPQAEVLPRSALVVTHGGSGSMLGALAHGVPMVVVPRQADQFENAAAVVAAGAAEALLPDDLTPDAVQLAVETVLREPRYREAAQGLAAEIAAMPSPGEVAEQLTRLVAVV
jgi:UDP:flavonoid glycosyltransferase YjiC (YdhE family)